MILNIWVNLEFFLVMFFSILAIVNTLFVLYSKNIIHSILYLVIVFFSICCILIILGADFIAAIFLMVYAGAIAMLFVFVFMMLNIKKSSRLLDDFHLNIGKAFALGILLFLQLFFVLFKSFFFESFYNFKMLLLGYVDLFYKLRFSSNIMKGVGLVFYTNFSTPFLLTGLLLLLGMIVTILLVIDNYLFYSFFLFQSRKLLFKSKFRQANSPVGNSKSSHFRKLFV